MSLLKSKCCGAEVEAVGANDFYGDKYPCTIHYECKKCHKSCDVEKKKITKSYIKKLLKLLQKA